MPPLSQKPAKRNPRRSAQSANQTQGSRTVTAGWIGPLPPPSLLADFDEIIPNGAERIMKLAEDEQTHRHSMDRFVVNADTKVISRGHWLGFTLSAISMIASVVTVVLGAHWSVSTALVGIPLAGVAKEFLKRK